PGVHHLERLGEQWVGLRADEQRGLQNGLTTRIALAQGEERVRRERRGLPQDRLDALGAERLEQTVAQRDWPERGPGARGIEADPILVEDVGAVYRHPRRLDARKSPEPLTEPCGVPLAPSRRLRKPLKLGARERGGQLAGQVHPAAHRRVAVRL